MSRILGIALFLLAYAFTSAAPAATFSKRNNINFYREVPSRNLSGLAIRSDGRIVVGPELSPLAGNPVADLWWDIESSASDKWLVGTGPVGEVLEINVDVINKTFSATTWAESDANHVFVLKRLNKKWVVGGTAPNAVLMVWGSTGTLQTSVGLPADSILDILTNEAGSTIWVSTGNPGRIYRVDLKQLVNSSEDDSLMDRGVELWGKVRDRNIRSLAWNANGRILAGSSPSGNLYEFPESGGDPIILMDQESGEISDIHLSDSGDIYAINITAKETATRRVTRSVNVTPPTESAEKKAPSEASSPAPSIMGAPPVEIFSGRSSLIKIPGGRGLPELVSSRNNLAMYQIIPYNNWLLLPGGDDGEFAGYAPQERRAISFAGSNSAQILEITPLETGTKYLALTNNPVGLSLLDFSSSAVRHATTKRINLQTPSEIGALRFNRIRHFSPEDLTVKMRANRGRDLTEGWTPWTDALQRHDGWLAPGLTGQYLQVKIQLPPDLDPAAELDQAEVHFLPQNRRPVLQSFRLISPNFGLSARSNGGNANPSLTLGQVIGTTPPPTKPPAERKRQDLLASQVIPQPGAQIALWTVADPDSDNLTATFSIRREGESAWTDLAVDSQAGWIQFDRTTLDEGTYFTRLVLSEQAPRPIAQRRAVTFHTDDLVIDLTPPAIEAVQIATLESGLTVTISGSDTVSLLSGVKLVFNNGHVVALTHPIDGILDSPVESFSTEIRPDDLAAATSIEVYLEDVAGNTATKRVPLN
ncbi:MAG: hypothetical protein HOH58_02545 [Opitutaceae bacterium]|nr:hypothetical protein [Opitutaceae bacterium]